MMQKPVETNRRMSASDCASVIRDFLRDCSSWAIRSVSKQGVSFVISPDSWNCLIGTDQCDCMDVSCEWEGSMSRCTVGQGSSEFSTFRRSVCMRKKEKRLLRWQYWCDWSDSPRVDAASFVLFELSSGQIAASCNNESHSCFADHRWFDRRGSRTKSNQIQLRRVSFSIARVGYDGIYLSITCITSTFPDLR